MGQDGTDKGSLNRVWLLIPSNYLHNFDQQIEAYYHNRSEAIRLGMTLTLQILQKYKKNATRVDQVNLEEAPDIG
jgi:hypothetical protein